jgi:hypothetical protein
VPQTAEQREVAPQSYQPNERRRRDRRSVADDWMTGTGRVVGRRPTPVAWTVGLSRVIAKAGITTVSNSGSEPIAAAPAPDCSDSAATVCSSGPIAPTSPTAIWGPSLRPCPRPTRQKIRPDLNSCYPGSQGLSEVDLIEQEHPSRCKATTSTGNVVTRPSSDALPRASPSWLVGNGPFGLKAGFCVGKRTLPIRSIPGFFRSGPC